MQPTGATGHDRAMPAIVTDFEQRTTSIDGLLVIRTKHVDDERGTVRELYRRSTFQGSIAAPRQVNLTSSRLGAIRGLHGEDMTKLVGLAAGRGYGAYLDVRPASASFGKLLMLELEPGTQVLVPSGVCNGFQACSEECLYLYCFDSEWEPAMPGVAVNALDPALAIAWPIAIDPTDRSLISEKDATLPNFADLGLARELVN
jgi:dTDP-4-dehydrorhamnose 3,5-epimerase